MIHGSTCDGTRICILPRTYINIVGNPPVCSQNTTTNTILTCSEVAMIASTITGMQCQWDGKGEGVKNVFGKKGANLNVIQESLPV